MSPYDQAVAEVDTFGFALLPDVLTASQADALRRALIHCAEEYGEAGYENRGGTSLLVRNLPTMDPVFLQIVDHPVVLPILERVLDKTLVLGSLSSRIVRPGDGYQDFHSDIPQHMLNPVSPVMMNTIWMLDEFNTEIGGTRIVPGSHKSGWAGPPEGMKVPHVYQPEAAAESVLIFNGQCWHSGGENTTDRNRHALFGHYRKSMLLFQLDPHDGFREDWYKRLSPRQKQLLRMEKGVGARHAADDHLV